MVFHPELLLAPERYEEVSCDDTGRRPVLRDRIFRIREVQSRLFTGRCVTPLPDVPSPRPWKRDGIKASHSASSTKPKASLVSGVTRCTNYHSCWSDFCSPVRATPDRVFTYSVHPCNFSAIQLSSSDLSPMKTPRYRLPVTTLIPMSQNKSSALATFCGATTKTLLVSSGKYLCGGPFTCNYWKCSRILPNYPLLSSVSSTYNDWVTQGCAPWISLIRGRTPIPY